ncbi:hypothetical protein [Thalassoroseus pseudoceratinae]|uniref:hypothetical protein n=1 Tax=Thalassoroseus pseudoceratinae TaxID=2713176 RepID=UPI001422B6A9|nr:hypothetical protein [Thalassoroseus pseudoceratinae]
MNHQSGEAFRDRVLDSRRVRWTLLLVGIVLWIPPIWRRVASGAGSQETSAVLEMASKTGDNH